MEFPVYHRREWVADAIIHAIGVVGALLATGLLLVRVAGEGWGSVLAASVFSITLIASFVFSAGYNLSMDQGRKRLLRRADHMSIYLLIAGAYTPIAGVVIGGLAGMWLLSLVWGLAAVGVWMRLFRPETLGRTPILLYLAMGWAVLTVFPAFLERMSTQALWLLLTSGVVYTCGVSFFCWRSLPYQNAIWHAFVLAGSALLYMSILLELT